MTRLFAAYDALLSTVQTVGAAQSVDVFDGPSTVNASVKRWAMVGCDDPEAAAPVLAIDNGNQEFVSLGGYVKDESFGIWCIYQAWTGASGYTTLRSDAETFIDALEDALALGNPAQTLSGPSGALGPTGWAGISITQMRQGQLESGPALRVQFLIPCTTRLFPGS